MGVAKEVLAGICLIALLLAGCTQDSGVKSLPPNTSGITTSPAVEEPKQEASESSEDVTEDVIEISRLVLPPRYDRDPYTPAYELTPKEELENAILLGKQLTFKANYTVSAKKGDKLFTSRRLWVVKPPDVRVDEFTLEGRKTFIFLNGLMTECDWYSITPVCQTVSNFDKGMFEGIFSEWEKLREKYIIEKGTLRGVAGKTIKCYLLKSTRETDLYTEAELCYTSAGAPLFIRASGETTVTIMANDYSGSVMSADFVPPTQPAPSTITEQRRARSINDFPLDPDKTEDYVRYYRGRV